MNHIRMLWSFYMHILNDLKVLIIFSASPINFYNVFPNWLYAWDIKAVNATVNNANNKCTYNTLVPTDTHSPFPDRDVPVGHRMLELYVTAWSTHLHNITSCTPHCSRSQYVLGMGREAREVRYMYRDIYELCVPTSCRVVGVFPTYITSLHMVTSMVVCFNGAWAYATFKRRAWEGRG